MVLRILLSLTCNVRYRRRVVLPSPTPLESSDSAEAEALNNAYLVHFQYQVLAHGGGEENRGKQGGLNSRIALRKLKPGFQMQYIGRRCRES